MLHTIVHTTKNNIYFIMHFTFTETDNRGCCGVFVCRGSHPVSHISNFGRVVTCNATVIMPNNICNEKDMYITSCRVAYNTVQGCITFTESRHHSQYCPWVQTCESMPKTAHLVFQKQILHSDSPQSLKERRWQDYCHPLGVSCLGVVPAC